MKEYQVSGNAFKLFPVDIIEGMFWIEDNLAVRIPKLVTYGGEWGEILTNTIQLEPPTKFPHEVSVIWVSIVENQLYYVENEIPYDKITSLFQDEEAGYTHIIIGIAPYGLCAIWVAGLIKSTLVCTLQGEKIDSSFFPELDFYKLNINIEQYCSRMLKSNEEAHENFLRYGLPEDKEFYKRMRQYTYRYVVSFENYRKSGWQVSPPEDRKEELSSIKDSRLDGTYSKLKDTALGMFHTTGKPQSFTIGWKVGKSEYFACFRIDEDTITDIFERFYGVHRDTKTDFIIRIDPEKWKYELALYRYGLKEPQVIAESAYQLIVFKNKFECYRSENYDQPRGAWIW